MNRWRRSPRFLTVFTGFALGVALLAALSGCDSGFTTLGRIIDVFDSSSNALSDETRRELGRFNSVYGKYVSSRADDDRELNHFRDAFSRLRVYYVRKVSDAELIDAAIKGVMDLEAELHSLSPPELVESALDSMLTSLDPHSFYLNPDELNELRVSTKGEFGGLGIEVTTEDGLIKVVSPIEDTPAYRAGIKSGDLITHLDGVSIKGMTLIQSVNRMRGLPGTSLRLTIVRSGGVPFDVSIVRELIKIRAVRWRAEGDIAYVRVSRFNEKLEKGILESLRDINQKLGKRLKGLVLDLRNNPGGLLDQSVVLADTFLEDGVIVSVRGRDPKRNRVNLAKAGDLARGLPIVVLINGGSASASEIVASALQDQGRATVMGARSFGKGSVQTIVPLKGGGALKFTTELYYAPSGRAIQAHGVEPDITLISVEVKPDTRESDLPGALPAVSAKSTSSRITLSEDVCPPVGENEDRQLGCALDFLRAGSAERFMSMFGIRSQI